MLLRAKPQLKPPSPSPSFRVHRKGPSLPSLLSRPPPRPKRLGRQRDFKIVSEPQRPNRRPRINPKLSRSKAPVGLRSRLQRAHAESSSRTVFIQKEGQRVLPNVEERWKIEKPRGYSQMAQKWVDCFGGKYWTTDWRWETDEGIIERSTDWSQSMAELGTEYQGIQLGTEGHDWKTEVTCLCREIWEVRSP